MADKQNGLGSAMEDPENEQLAPEQTEAPAPDAQEPALGAPIVPQSSSPSMKPLGGEEAPPQQEAKLAPPVDPAKELAKQHEMLQQEKLEAASKGDLVGLGTALLKEKELNKTAPMKAVIEKAAQPTPNPHILTGVLPTIAAGKEPANTGAGLGSATFAPPSADAGKEDPTTGVGLGADAPHPGFDDKLGSAAPQQDFKEIMKRYDEGIQAARDKGTPDGDTEAGHLERAKLTFEKQHPYGSAMNHPGLLGKIEHGLAEVGNVAGAALVPGVEAAIPGSALNRQAKDVGAQADIEEGEKGKLSEAQAEHEKEIAAAAARDSKLAGQLLLKGYVAKQDANGNFTLDQVPGFRDAPKSAQEVYASAVASALEKNPEEDPAKDPKVTAALDALKAFQKASQPNAEANKEAQQAFISKLGQLGYKTDAADLDKSVDQAVADKKITTKEAADFRGFQGVNPNPATNIVVSGEQAKQRQNIKDAHTYYSYTDDDGTTHLVTGDKVPQDAESTKINNVEQYVGEARAGNVVQKNLNLIAQDVHDHPELWDSPELRNILATATEDINRASAGILIAGTGGSIPIPAGLGHMINTYLEKFPADKKGSEALRQYIADYKAMKDKALVMQMEIQNGKIGRAGAQGFLSITNQIPDGDTPDSKTALRQVGNLQLTQSGLMQKYPDKYQDFVKEHPYEPKESPKESSQGESKGHVILYKGSKYQYKGTGATNDIKNYTPLNTK
jgi:hypothetical protein